MSVRRTLSGALLAAGIALSLGHTAQAQVRTSFGPTTTDISTGHAGHSSLPQELGYWAEEGLEVEVFGVAGSTAGVQLMMAGNIDFLSISPEEVVAARHKGFPIQAVYTHARTPIGRVVVPKGSGITGLADLKGKTVGRPVISPSPYAVATFREAGVDYHNDFKVVATGTGAPAFLALQRGDVDAWVSWDTAVAALENRGMVFDDYRPSFFNDMIGNVIVTREEVIENNPELVVKMTRAIAKAVHFGLNNPEAAVRIHWEAYPQTRPQGGDEEQLLKEATHVFMSRFQSYDLVGTDLYGENLASQWDHVIKLMKEFDELPADAEIEGVYTNAFIKEINQWDREAIASQAKAAVIN